MLHCGGVHHRLQNTIVHDNDAHGETHSLEQRAEARRAVVQTTRRQEVSDGYDRFGECDVPSHPARGDVFVHSNHGENESAPWQRCRDARVHPASMRDPVHVQEQAQEKRGGVLLGLPGSSSSLRDSAAYYREAQNRSGVHRSRDPVRRHVACCNNHPL